MLLASLRERIVGGLVAQPLAGDFVIEIASAHLYEQARRDRRNAIIPA